MTVGANEEGLKQDRPLTFGALLLYFFQSGNQMCAFFIDSSGIGSTLLFQNDFDIR